MNLFCFVFIIIMPKQQKESNNTECERK